MNDLISRSALIVELQKGTIISDDLYGMGIMSGVDFAMKRIAEAPSVDAVPVVRCGECIKPIEECPFKDHVMLKTDYCSYGERRNGDG